MDDFLSNKNLIHALKMISPGTPLRQGLDNILKAKIKVPEVEGDKVPEVEEDKVPEVEEDKYDNASGLDPEYY